MILVADAGPLRYLVLVEYVELLKSLYGHAALPFSVTVELQHPSTPDSVRTWIARLPDWCEIYPDPPSILEVEGLGAGERAAISLANSLHADRLLVDDAAARAEAIRRQIPVIGTLGVLAEAHRHRLVDFESAIARLQQTNFYVSDELITAIRLEL